MQQMTDVNSLEHKARMAALKAVVVIGASTGGPTALSQILPKFPRDFPAAFIIVQHMQPGFIKLVARHIDSISELEIDEVQDARILLPGTALFTPVNCDVQIEKNAEASPPIYTLIVKEIGKSFDELHKRVDNAMMAAARQFGRRTIGIILTGVGNMGCAGMKEIHDQGGITIVQDGLSSVVFDMPKAAIEAGVVDEILPLWNIADRVIELVGEL